MIMYYTITNNFCSLCISKIFIVFQIFPIFYISWRPSWIFDITIHPIMLKFSMIMYYPITNNFYSLCISKMFIVFPILLIFYISWRAAILDFRKTKFQPVHVTRSIKRNSSSKCHGPIIYNG